MQKRFICDVAKDIGCDVDYILRIAANDLQSLTPPFFLLARLTDGLVIHVNYDGEPIQYVTNNLQVAGKYCVLVPNQVSLLRRNGEITLTKFVGPTDAIVLDDWSWLKLEPKQEITIKNVAIYLDDIPVLQTLLSKLGVF